MASKYLQHLKQLQYVYDFIINFIMRTCSILAKEAQSQLPE